MLDFNHPVRPTNDINNALNELIDEGLAAERKAKNEREHRNYLGASQLGHPCSRALQYGYMSARAVNNDSAGTNDAVGFSGQTLRIFEAGHLFEQLAIKWLRDAGLELLTQSITGEQFGFKAADGKIAGHIDGIIRAAPPALNMGCPALWEAKSMNSKSWRDTVKKGLVLSKPIYATQIALYQAYMEPVVPDISQNPALFTAINKDTAEIYHELVPFDAALAQRMSDKAVSIIKATEAKELLPRTFTSPEFFECKMCAYRNKCWG